MGIEGSPEGQVDARRLRWIMLIPCAWIVFAIIISNFIIELFALHVQWLENLNDVIGIFLIGGSMLYLLVKVRNERFLAGIVLTSMFLLLLSVSLRMARTQYLANNLLPENVEYLLRRFEIAFNGLGIAAIMFAFFYAIVDLLVARQQSMAEQARLSQEMMRREKIEEALRENEAALQTISTSALDAIVMLDNTGLVSFWNPAAERILGYTAHEIAGTPLHDILASAVYRDAYQRNFPVWQSTGQGLVVGKTMELKARRKDEVEIDIELSVSSVRKAGQWCAVGILRDVTERKRREDVLRKYGRILSATPDLISLVDRNYCYQAVNYAYLKAATKKYEEIVGHHVREVIGNETFEKFVKSNLDRCLAGETTYREAWLSFAAGRRFLNITYSPYFDVDNTISGVVISGRDITEIKHTEQALRRSESKYRELVENANSIILRLDCDGRITFFNEFAQRFFGYTEAEIIGKNAVGTIVPAEDREGRDLASLIRDIRDDTAAHVNNENENMRRDGERVWIAWTNKPIVDDAGHVQEVLCVGNDITSRVRAERLLAAQRVKMIESARLAALGIMAGGIAHEINNPLAVIAGCAEQLEARGEGAELDSATTTMLLGMIRRNAGRIQKTIQGLRSLSRDASSDPFVEASVTAIVEDTVELGCERFRLHDIHVETETPDRSLTVECRPSQISQVILNLLNNSFDAVKDLPDKWIRLTVADRGECVEIAVEDSGPGIPKDIAEHVFVPFFTTKSEHHGIGLGLSISHAIVETHHGEIAADPSCGHTRFFVRLPKRQVSLQLVRFPNRTETPGSD